MILLVALGGVAGMVGAYYVGKKRGVLGILYDLWVAQKQGRIIMLKVSENGTISTFEGVGDSVSIISQKKISGPGPVAPAPKKKDEPVH